MLGNCPGAILALALSRLGATVVPLDPTTGVRDLTLFWNMLRCGRFYPPGRVVAMTAVEPSADRADAQDTRFQAKKAVPTAKAHCCSDLPSR